METSTTEQQVSHFQSLSSFCPATGKSAVTIMVKAFQHDEEWFESLFVHDLASDEPMGRLVEVAGKSLIIESSQACLNDRRFHLRLKLPSAVLGNSQILLEASCSDSHRQADGTYRHSFTALEADPADMDALEMLIMKFAIRHMG